MRVEYNGVILGDSSTIQVLPNGTANYNFTTGFEYSPDGPNSLVDIAQKPVLCEYLLLHLAPRRGGGGCWQLLRPAFLLQESLGQE